MNQTSFVQRKNWLWLLILPPLLSFALVSVVKPMGRFAFWIELAIFCLSSFSCGFALAIRHLKTFKQRVWGGIVLSGGSLYLISCVIFLGCIPIPIVTHQSPQQIAGQRRKFEEQMKESVARKIPPRDAGAGASMLDLTPFYNSLLPAQGFPQTKFFRALQPGVHIFEGIEFDARGMIRLSWVQQVTNIPVGQKCLEIDFLHGAGNGDNASVATLFVVHFANGHVETVPIVFGQDVGTSYLGRGSDETGAAFTNSVVWEDRSSTNALPQPAFRLFIKKWPNPFPDETVKMIDLVAPQEMSSAFLVAITIRQADEGNK